MIRRNRRISERERKQRVMRLLTFSGAMVVSGGLGIVYALRGEVMQALACAGIFCAAGAALWGDAP